MSQPLVVLFGLGLAIGLPAYYVVIKRRAASSLRRLLEERFSPRPCNIPEIPTPRGPVLFREAYDDRSGSGLVLVLGYWRRSRTAYNLVAGLFKPGGQILSRGMERHGTQVLIAASVAGGDLVVWKGLPSRDSVLAHLQSVR